MFLCNLDGKLYSDENIFKEIQLITGQEGLLTKKEKDVQVCLNCYGLMNMNYSLDDKGRFKIPIDDKIKVYRISCSNFGSKHDNEDKDENHKLVTNILKTMKKSEKVKCKK